MSSLIIEHLSMGYQERTVLHDVSLSIPAGQLVGLIGPNGAGKTTLLRAISGTLAPAQGNICLDGVNLGRLPPIERARRVAAVPQRSHMPEGFTLGETVLMGRTPHLPRFGNERPCDIAAAREAMIRTGTLELAARPINQLSGGEQQRMLIARALTQAPQVLLLDEATAHLDLKHQIAILSLVRGLTRSGLIVIAALHDLNLAALYADRLALLRDGALLTEGVPSEVLTPDWLQRAYDVTVVVSRHPLYRTPLVALLTEEAPV